MNARTTILQGVTLTATVDLLVLIAVRTLMTSAACRYLPESERPLISTGLVMAVVPPLVIFIVGGYVALGLRHAASRVIGMAFVITLSGFVFVWLGMLSMWCG